MPEDDKTQATSNTERQIRVFVSSTFRDMQLDRDFLIKKIFPQFRKMCEERAISWTEVDLRWGITDEQRAEGECCRCVRGNFHTRADVLSDDV